VEKIKQILHYLSSMLLYALLMILVVVVLMVVVTIGDRMISLKNHQSKAPLFSAYVIISPSMVPNINVYDAVITARVPQNRIGMYDVITFLSKEIETHGVPITHRVVGILKTEDGERAYRTKGDNNNKEDKAIILQSEVIGKVLFRIPMLGYVRTFVTSKIGFLISVVLPITASLFLEIWRFIHKRKERLQEKQKESQMVDSADVKEQEILSSTPSSTLENIEVPVVPPLEKESLTPLSTISSPPTSSSSEPSIENNQPSTVAPIEPVTVKPQPIASLPNIVNTNSSPTISTSKTESVEPKSVISQENPITVQPQLSSLKSESEEIEDIFESIDQDSQKLNPDKENSVNKEDDDDIEVI